VLVLPKIGDVAPEFRLPATTGESISVRDFFGEPVLLVFLEQPGSLFGREHLAALRRHSAELDQIPAAVLVISFAPLERLRALTGELSLPFPCLSDPDLQAYTAYALQRGELERVLTFRAMAALAKLMLCGRRLPRTEGDPLQMGGDFVIDREGRLRLTHRMAELQDRPSVPDLLGLLRQAAWMGRLE
jgi:peroxiredoxin